MRIGEEEFEILVRRQGETGYSAFCPQLELIVRGTAHVQVEQKMQELIVEHVAKRDREKTEGAAAQTSAG